MEGLAIATAVEPALSGTVALGTIVVSGKQLVTYLIGRKQTNDDPDDTTTLPVEHKEHVAIVLEITRPIAADVIAYLDRNQIDANLVVIRRQSADEDNYAFLDATDQDLFADLVRDFARACTEVQSRLGQVTYHIFLSAPMPLVFGAGAVWGTVREATVYHYSGTDYVPSLPLDRSLRY